MTARTPASGGDEVRDPRGQFCAKAQAIQMPHHVLSPVAADKDRRNSATKRCIAMWCIAAEDRAARHEGLGSLDRSAALRVQQIQDKTSTSANRTTGARVEVAAAPFARRPRRRRRRERLRARGAQSRAPFQAQARMRVAPERCPSGLRSATGNRVRAERCVAGSNPALSADAGETRFPPRAPSSPHGAAAVERRRRDSNPRWRHSSP